jgi:transcriptional regulator with XRE-family HTH domain
MPKTKKNNYERLVAQETLILDATEALIAQMEKQEVSRQELAARLGKSKGLVSQLLSGERNMTLRTLADLAYVLGSRFALSVRDVAEAPGVHTTDSDSAPPRDQEHRAETPVETVEDWIHVGSADAHEYALAA